MHTSEESAVTVPDPIRDLVQGQTPGEVLAAPSVPHRNPLVQDLTGTAPVVNWILPNWLPQGSLFTLVGDAGAGKSFLCYALGMSLATGKSFLGFTPPHPWKVLYFDQENSYPDRIQYERWAWEGLHRPDLSTLAEHFWVNPFGLGQGWYARMQADLLFHKPQLVIVDTATPAFDIQVENDNSEATRICSQLRTLQHLVTPAPTIIVLRHAKFDAMAPAGHQLSGRGAKTWKGSTDGQMFLLRHRGRPRKDGLTPTLLRPDKVRAFGLREEVPISPEYIGAGASRGITLHRTAPLIEFVE